ncbi:glycosyltransferase family 9 protein [Bordetella bronchiseptica]
MPGYQLSASGQHLPSTQAAAPIVRSWERCASATADLHDDPVALRHGDLQERLEQHACVLRAAQPEIETLAGMVASASSLVLLADASGVILQASGNTGFLQRADHVALRPGVSWAENHRGTNAIGTALIEAAALRVHGAEHFLRRNQILSCHAAPIRSPRGDILGVLDISGDAGRMHAYALSLASMCARQVANRVIEQAGERCLYLVFHKQASLLDSVERGLLLIEDERIVGANDAAVALLGATWPALLDQPLTQAHRDAAGQLLQAQQLAGRPFVLIAPTATGLHKGKVKVWPGFDALTRALQERGQTVVMCPPPAEVAEARRNAPSATLLPPLGLGAFAALAQRAALVVCNDSGVSHVAAAVDARQLTLFGVTRPGRTGPWSPRAVCLGSETRWPGPEQVMEKSLELLSGA